MSDYIEREAAEKMFEDAQIISDGEYSGYCTEDVNLSNIPAADVAPVRHGKWIEDERTYPGPGLKNNLCSACGEVAGAWKEGLEPGRKWAYCPNCGARMDKEDEHETD